MAKVEGGFERVTWTLSGPSEATREAAVDRDERRTMEVSFKPGKGGDYELTAVAEGPAGRMESQPVRFSIAREDAWVRIDEPASGASVSTGDNLGMKAHASGEEANSILTLLAGKLLAKGELGDIVEELLDKRGLHAVVEVLEQVLEHT